MMAPALILINILWPAVCAAYKSHKVQSLARSLSACLCSPRTVPFLLQHPQLWLDFTLACSPNQYLPHTFGAMRGGDLRFHLSLFTVFRFPFSFALIYIYFRRRFARSSAAFIYVYF